MKKLNHEALFRASPYPYLVMDTALNIIGASDAYLRSTGRTEDELLGRYVFDAFPENPDDPESTSVAQVKASLEKAIATGKPDTTAFLRYAVPLQTDDGTVFEERYWSTVHTPVFGADGQVEFVIQNAIDVTELYSFDKYSQQARLDPQLKAVKGAENFNRAQMHEAMVRILSDERGHLRNLFNQAPGFVAVLTGPRHVFELVNEAYYQLVGHREIVGKPVWEALPEVAGQGFEELLDKVYESGQPFVGRALKLVVQREPDGPLSEIYVDLLYQPYFDDSGKVSGIFAQGHEVTDAVLAQAAQRESEERLREGMLAARMVVWDWDAATGQVRLSDNAPLVLGTASDDPDALTSGLDRDDLARVREQRLRAGGDGSFEEIVRFTRPDNGVPLWLDLRGKTRLDAQGGMVGIRGVALDVTERIRAEDELRDAARRKDEFLAMLAHELRNPLAPVSAAAQLLKTTHLDEARLRQTSDIITRQIRHMTDLVDDLIDVSRVTRGLIGIDKAQLDLKRIIADAVEQVQPAIERKQHTLELLLAPESARIVGDQKRMVQVLTNLLNNAAKYTPDGGTITLRMRTTLDEVELAVADDGCGIAPALLPHVFDLFTQAERTSDRSQGGLGIGLALVKSLVELHGGRVGAYSDGEGRGSTFTLTLPRLAADSVPETAEPAPAAREDGGGVRILIVDDNADAAEMLAMLLDASGYRTQIEHGAHAALDRARSFRPDVCLLDIGLPEMDGIELARHLRSRTETAHAQLIAVSGYGQEQDRKKGLEGGFDYYMVKPVDTDKLLALLAKLKL
ncbi:MAG TPA: ATP-binding protein [Burkholderiaceae bacterium]